MAKVDLANVDPRAFIEARGRIMVLNTVRGAVIAKWPKKRKAATSGYNYYRQQEFGLNAKWASNPLDLDLGTAVEMAKGTEQVPRDILMMAQMGLYYVIVDPQGHEWEPARMTTNAQWILDQVTNVEGSILYRAPIGWLGLPPGAPGDALITDGSQVYWGALIPPGTGPVSVANNWTGASTSNYASKGVVLNPIKSFKFLEAWGPVNEVAGQSYRWGVYELGPTNLIAAVTGLTLPWTAAITQRNVKATPFPNQPLLEAGKKYVLLHTRTSATNTTSSGLYAGSGNAAAMPVDQDTTYVAYASNNPAIGMAPGTTGTNPYAHGGLVQYE